jgi:hypothetical protein
MTEKKTEEDGLKALREDPDYQALVRALKKQTPDQVDAFLEQAEREEQADNDKEE